MASTALRIVEQRDARRSRNVLDTVRYVATSSAETSTSTCSGIVRRQCLDMDLARTYCTLPAHLHTRGVADELNRSPSHGSAGRAAPHGNRRA